jgi:hypothetical protein
MRQDRPANDARQSCSHVLTARGLFLGAQLGSHGLTQPVAARRLHASSCIEIDPCGMCGKGCHNLDGACLHAGGKCTLKGTSVWTGARYAPRTLALLPLASAPLSCGSRCSGMPLALCCWAPHAFSSWSLSLRGAIQHAGCKN